MIDTLKLWLKKPAVLFAILLLQAVSYWIITIYIGSEAIPVAYQRF